MRTNRERALELKHRVPSDYICQWLYAYHILLHKEAIHQRWEAVSCIKYVYVRIVLYQMSFQGESNVGHAVTWSIAGFCFKEMSYPPPFPSAGQPYPPGTAAGYPPNPVYPPTAPSQPWPTPVAPGDVSCVVVGEGLARPTSEYAAWAMGWVSCRRGSKCYWLQSGPLLSLFSLAPLGLLPSIPSQSSQVCEWGERGGICSCLELCFTLCTALWSLLVGLAGHPPPGSAPYPPSTAFPTSQGVPMVCAA